MSDNNDLHSNFSVDIEHPLLKILKEFNVNFENIGEIDDDKYNKYEEILSLYLNDIDDEFIEKKKQINNCSRIILSIYPTVKGIAMDYFDNKIFIDNVRSYYSFTKNLYMHNCRLETNSGYVICYLVAIKITE